MDIRMLIGLLISNEAARLLAVNFDSGEGLDGVFFCWGVLDGGQDERKHARRAMTFEKRNRIHAWREDLSRFISELCGSAPRKVHMMDIKESKTLAVPKLEHRDLQAHQSRLGPSMLVKGEISGNEDLIVEGAVEGVVHLNDRKLIVGPRAKVKADITAGEVVVRGNLKGNILARGRIEVMNDGSVTGDLTTPQIFIEGGALFKGSIEIDKNTTWQAQENVLSASELAPAKAIAAAASANNI